MNYKTNVNIICVIFVYKILILKDHVVIIHGHVFMMLYLDIQYVCHHINGFVIIKNDLNFV